MTEQHPVVLATSDYYFPGDKGGGAVHALANMVSRLGESWSFKIVTRDRDFGDVKPYDRIDAGRWQKLGAADVNYLPPRGRLRMLLTLMRTAGVDVQYHNSFFSPAFTFPLLLARKLGLIPRRPLIVAPRGEFSPGALGINWAKKRAYIFLVKAAGLCQDAIWHVSTEYEEADVRRYFGKQARVVVARDCLPPVGDEAIQPIHKTKGALDIVFLSRICRMKNLHGALSMLSGLRGSVRMRIYGPLEDKNYWSECQGIIGSLPSNIQIEYCGMAAHDDVLRVMASHHLFFLPTYGENFGFVIFEALLAGRPVLISDQTPWHDLQEKGIGWDLPLQQPARFLEALQACVDMDETVFSKLSEKAKAHALQIVRDDPSVGQSVLLFKAALA